MIKIRKNVFETNSSSTHSIAIVEDTQLNNWKNGKIYFCVWDNSFIDKQTAEAIRCYTFLQSSDENYSDELITALQDNTFLATLETLINNDVQNRPYEYPLTYEEFCNSNSDLEEDYNEYTTTSGDKIHIFCSYGCDY